MNLEGQVGRGSGPKERSAQKERLPGRLFRRLEQVPVIGDIFIKPFRVRRLKS